jgi:MbtH protein
MAEEKYYVVRNGEEQYSVWIEGCSLPAGWEVVGEPASKQECLNRIEQFWTDPMPRSVREHLKQNAMAEVERAL